MNEAIKPCPFCGHVGLDFREGSTFRRLMAECCGCGATCGETRVQTLPPGTKDEWMQKAQQDAIAAWNNRAGEQA
jgi:Lar family restriction alleviation protein